jgi:hypothetical protein
MVSLCYFGKPVRYELGNPADFAVVLFRNEALEQVREETRQCLGAELQAQPVIEDPTLDSPQQRHLGEATPVRCHPRTSAQSQGASF